MANANQILLSERNDIIRLLDEEEKKEIAEVTSDDPGWEERIEQRKDKYAIGKLGVEALVKQKEELDAQLEAIEKQIAAIDKKIEAKMPKYNREKYGCARKMDLCIAVSKIAKTFHHRVMHEDAAGKKVIAIEKKYDKKRILVRACTDRSKLAEIL